MYVTFSNREEKQMKIENNRYCITFTTQGGEMTSFYDKQLCIEYLYGGDSPYWSGKNPTLFPLVGNTYNKTYTIDGKEYAMKNHGLIRYAQLTCVKHENTSITFQLQANAETLLAYPFLFTYEITYTLNEQTVKVEYEITNNDEKRMPFTFGLHPAFKVPLVEGEQKEAYTLSFEQEECMQQLIFNDGKVRYEDICLHSMNTDFTLFEKYLTLIYRGYKSSYVTLKGTNGHGVKMQISGYPLLALWTPHADAPFVCIEPWFSHADFEEVRVPFEKREGMMQLESKEVFKSEYTIEVF